MVDFAATPSGAVAAELIDASPTSHIMVRRYIHAHEFELPRREFKSLRSRLDRVKMAAQGAPAVQLSNTLSAAAAAGHCPQAGRPHLIPVGYRVGMAANTADGYREERSGRSLPRQCWEVAKLTRTCLFLNFPLL
jgi:hypothetical protein